MPVFHSSCSTKPGAVYVQDSIINTSDLAKSKHSYTDHNMDKSNENNPEDIGECNKSFFEYEVLAVCVVFNFSLVLIPGVVRCSQKTIKATSGSLHSQLTPW